MDFIPADKPLEKEMRSLFTKSISFQLPAAWKEFLVKVIPWILILLIPVYILTIGFTAFASLFRAFTAHLLGSLGMLFTCIGLIFSLFSLRGMFNRKREGWVYTYYAFLLFLVADILYLQFFEAVVTFLFFGYLLFQIRGYYK